MAMRRDDLSPPVERVDGPTTLDDALRVPNLDDADVVRTLWDDLAAEVSVIEQDPPRVSPWATPVVVTPAPTPVVEPEPATDPPTLRPPVPSERAPGTDPEPTRRELKREHQAARDEQRLEKLKLRRHRILPRTVIGIASMLLFFGLGAGVAGAALYAYYDWRLSENEQRIGDLSTSLERRLEAANQGLEDASNEAVANVQRQMGPFRQLMDQYGVARDLVGQLNGGVWSVETLDENGGPSVGSAFVVASDDAQSLLVTSYSAVAAGTTDPGPTITLRSGDESFEGELYNWDPEHDLALLVLPRGGLTPLPWADNATMADLVGTHVWAAEGFGGNGVSVSPGTVIDLTDVGLQHTVALNAAFRGGPIVNGRGEVVGIASQSYAPLNYPSGAVSFGVPVQASCERVLSCSGDVPGAGEGN
jgi:S1-C subfamily serine protease